MHHTILSKVFSLIDKTGDRCIVLSEENESAYVVMSLNEYERLTIHKSEVAALTEDELLDKINRDIAVWKSRQSADEADSDDYGSVSGRNDWAEDEFGQDAEPGEPLFSQAGDSEFGRGAWDEDSWDEDSEDEEEDPYYFESV